jgi:hypothetical protein
MKDLLTTKNLTYVGVGLLTAFVVYNYIVNREKSTIVAKPPVSSKTDDKSSFCGCGA